MSKSICVHKEYCAFNCKEERESKCILKNTALKNLPLYSLIKKQCEKINLKYQ